MSITSYEFISVSAILLGPILAIIASQVIENLREKRARKMEIFRTLMRTRRTPVVPEHVGALNLIEIEFAKRAKIIDAWKELLRHFADEHTRKPNEVNSPTDPHELLDERDRKYANRLHNERQSLLAKLLHAIARDLGHKAEQLEIFEGGYSPQGWSNVEEEQRAMRKFVLDLYLGRRVVPVGVMEYAIHHENPSEQLSDNTDS